MSTTLQPCTSAEYYARLRTLDLTHAVETKGRPLNMSRANRDYSPTYTTTISGIPEVAHKFINGEKQFYIRKL